MKEFLLKIVKPHKQRIKLSVKWKQRLLLNWKLSASSHGSF